MSSNNAKPLFAMPAKRMTAAGASSKNNNSNGNVTVGTAAATGALNNGTLNLNGMTRLTPPRDLTLGGRGGASNKKVFAPNLNAVRNRNANVKTSKDLTAARGGRRGGRGVAGAAAARGGGRGGGNSTLIQTTGVFSEGAGAVHLRKSSGPGSVYSRADEEVAIARKRTERKQDEKSLRMRELLGTDDGSDGNNGEIDNDVAADKTDLAYKPIMLCEGLWRHNKLDVKEDTQGIPNLSTNSADPLTMAQQLQTLHMNAEKWALEDPPPQYGRYPRSIRDFLDAPQTQILLMQLPDVLPCVGDDADDAATTDAAKADVLPPASPDAPNSPTSTSTTVPPKHSMLKQLEEGQIGKILRYRSGRVKLMLGDTRFDLEMGLDSGFLQELMSITTNREERSGNMINLGPIQAKLKATPDWVHLFEQQETAARQTPAVSARSTTTTATPAATEANVAGST